MNKRLAINWPGVFLFALTPALLWHPIGTMIAVLLGVLLSWKLVKPTRPVVMWVALLAIFFFFPYSSINPAVRSGGHYFTLYRKLGGVVSVWDVLILIGLIDLLMEKLKKGNLAVRGFHFPEIFLLSLFGLWAFFWGWLHVSGNLFGYGPTDSLRPVVIFQVFLYFMVVYFLTLNWLTLPKDWETAVYWLKVLTWMLALYGLVRLVGIGMGKLETMWPFGLPVVLYDQMMMLYLPIFVWVASLFLGNAHWKGLGWLAMLSVFFILISARRFNYFLLVAGIFLTLSLTALQTDRFAKKAARVFLKLITALVLVFIVVSLLFPSGLKNVGMAFQSMNIYGENSTFATGSDIRRQELKNLLLNLNERPYGYLVGLGWGTKWKAITYQPIDSFSFTQKYLQKGLGWFPQFHLPYLGLIYRYGILGLLFLWGALALLFYRIFQCVRRVRSENQKPLLIGMLVFLFLLLPTFGDSANPTFMILSGFYLGLLEFRLTAVEALCEA